MRFTRLLGAAVLVIAVAVAIAPWPAGGWPQAGAVAAGVVGGPAAGGAAFAGVHVHQEPTRARMPGQCRIVLVLDTLTAPPWALGDWRRAAAEFSRLSHLQVTVRSGEVADPEAFAVGPGKRRVAVVYAPPSQMRSATHGGAVLATVGAFVFPSMPRRVFTQSVTVNSEAMSPWVFGPDRRLAVLLHELGHIAGLDHSRAKGTLMHPLVSGDTVVTHQDRADLWRATARCTSDGSRSYLADTSVTGG